MEQKTKTFLDEGFDFIEESYSAIPLEFTETDKDIIVEAKGGTPSPYHILGVCRGVFQPVNEPSRNGRIYDPDHWQYQISKPELQERLQNRQMLGQIGHRNERVNDFTLSAGEVSHVVTKMEIREGADGKPYLYGELEILDTPAGRILKALYEGGVGLYISSRGAGKLETIPGQTLKRVSKNSFFLETWDIVKAPGYLKARPVYESAIPEDKNVNESEDDDDHLIPPVHPVEKVNNDLNKKESEVKFTEKPNGEKFEQILQNKMKEQQEEPKNESIEELKGQINQLAKILEKVVDDVYEQEEPIEETPEGAKEKEMEKKSEEAPQMQKQPIAPVKESLVDFVKLMADSNISEEAFSEVLDMIKGAI